MALLQLGGEKGRRLWLSVFAREEPLPFRLVQKLLVDSSRTK
jgi:hypothetical protein